MDWKRTKELSSQDSVCSRVKRYCTSGWPKKRLIEAELLPYWKVRNSLTLYNGPLLYNSCIVVPHSLQLETLEKIHEGHQGIEHCRMLINSSVWWPGVSQSIAEKIRKYTKCTKESMPKKEPLLNTPLPDYPWQMVRSDLFEISGEHYLLVMDYFSRLTSITSAAVITSLKFIFMRHGIFEVLRNDNSPQYASQQFLMFAESYGFQHSTSSLRYPQSNGQAERTVKQQSSDLLLNYCATPLPWCRHSPAELLMRRRLRTRFPQLPDSIQLTWSYTEEFRK